MALRHLQLTSIGAIALGAALVLSGCSSGDSATPEISNGQAPAPGSQTGIHAVADTDYEQIALAVDTAQIELSELARAVNQKASKQVVEIADQAMTLLPDDAKSLRQQLIDHGNALTAEHHKADFNQAELTTLRGLTGPAFDKAWAQEMITLNDQVIQAAVTEMNVGEDPKTRALARAKIDYASSQNAALKRITGG